MIPARPGRRPSGPEAGSSLIEVLIAVAIMSIMFVAVVGGIATAILGAEVQKRQAGIELALRTAAESITYQPCATPAAYQPVPAPGAKVTVTVTRVSYWNGTGAFVTTPPCVDTGLQLVEFAGRPTGAADDAAVPLQVVKRRP